MAEYGDLLTIAPVRDQSVTSLEAWFEDAVIRFYRYLEKVKSALRWIPTRIDTLAASFS